MVLDTNVLVFVFASAYDIDPIHTRRGAPYTRAYWQLLSLESEVVLLDVVLGEFFGVLESMASRYWHRVGAGRNLPEVKEWQQLKRFRREGPYQTLLKDFRQATADILKRARFEKVDLDQATVGPIQDDLDAKRIDFNDILIARHCEKTRRTLLTSDSDMVQFQDRIDIVHGE